MDSEERTDILSNGEFDRIMRKVKSGKVIEGEECRLFSDRLRAEGYLKVLDTSKALADLPIYPGRA